jgi:hypothetical protein
MQWLICLVLGDILEELALEDRLGALDLDFELASLDIDDTVQLNREMEE